MNICTKESNHIISHQYYLDSKGFIEFSLFLLHSIPFHSFVCLIWTIIHTCRDPFLTYSFESLVHNWSFLVCSFLLNSMSRNTIIIIAIQWNTYIVCERRQSLQYSIYTNKIGLKLTGPHSFLNEIKNDVFFSPLSVVLKHFFLLFLI